MVRIPSRSPSLDHLREAALFGEESVTGGATSQPRFGLTRPPKRKSGTRRADRAISVMGHRAAVIPVGRTGAASANRA
jgi:hypothetical protein